MSQPIDAPGGARRCQVALDRRQADVDDRAVDEGQARAEDGRGEGSLAVPCGLRRACGGGKGGVLCHCAIVSGKSAGCNRFRSARECFGPWFSGFVVDRLDVRLRFAMLSRHTARQQQAAGPEGRGHPSSFGADGALCAWSSIDRSSMIFRTAAAGMDSRVDRRAGRHGGTVVGARRSGRLPRAANRRRDGAAGPDHSPEEIERSGVSSVEELLGLVSANFGSTTEATTTANSFSPGARRPRCVAWAQAGPWCC